MPLDMSGEGRTVASVAGCKQRCVDTSGCNYYNSFPNGGCHVSTGTDGSWIDPDNHTASSGTSDCIDPLTYTFFDAASDEDISGTTVIDFITITSSVTNPATATITVPTTAALGISWVRVHAFIDLSSGRIYNDSW